MNMHMFELLTILKAKRILISD